jgi:hypothetical protein
VEFAVVDEAAGLADDEEREDDPEMLSSRNVIEEADLHYDNVGDLE